MLSAAFVMTSWAITEPNHPDCDLRTNYISHNSQTLPRDLVVQVIPRMALSQVIAMLGPGIRDIGSSMYAIQWNVDGGSTLTVRSTLGLCSKVVSSTLD